MCGYLGYISKNSNISNDDFKDANKYIECRGPDNCISVNSNQNSSIQLLKKYNYNFTFNRLKIVDLADDANQPMYSEKYQSLILFNGEIFNHVELRKELESYGEKFYTKNSDTEVLLIGLSKFGINYLNKLNGQFSVYFMKMDQQIAYLIRDRLGQKPLFYSIDENNLIFGSNLKALNKLKNSEIYEYSIYEYLNFGVIPSPNTLYKNILKLEPATYIKIDLETFKTYKTKYWELDKFQGNNVFDSDIFNSLYENSIKLRSQADVEVACFLSGGLDSSSIISNLAKQVNSVNTFSVNFKNTDFDESHHSKLVAEKFSTNHKGYDFYNDISIDLIEKSIEIFDEPYSDPSTVPSFLISKLMSETYRVGISGDGGDELMGGYYRTQKLLKKRFSIFPEKLFNFYPSILGSGSNILSLSKNDFVAYKSFFSDKKLLNLLNIDYIDSFDRYRDYKFLDNYKFFQFIELDFYLSEMMNLKVDRTSMANSLEVRSPFQDFRLVEYVYNTNSSGFQKIPKFVIKDKLSQHFENEFINRKKQGFVFDTKNWVYDNLENINQTFQNGKIVTNIDENILTKLSRVRTTQNALRIWKLFFLEKYFQSS